MRSKILFLLIFVFSFIIVHDTVLDVMQPSQEIVLEKSSCVSDSNKYQSLHHLHNMFHFVALIEDAVSFIAPLKTEVKITSLFLPILYADNTQLVRPPIA